MLMISVGVARAWRRCATVRATLSLANTRLELDRFMTMVAAYGKTGCCGFEDRRIFFIALAQM